MLILGIETATDICSVALLDGETLLGESSVSEPRSHASRLVPMIKEVLHDVGLAPTDLDVVAVSAGPGSYTGLRIGASTAKGLAFATGASLVAVPTLEALAFGVLRFAQQPVLVVLPSRRGEVYAAVYGSDRDGLKAISEPCAIELSSLRAWIPTGSYQVMGPGAQAVLEVLADPVRYQFLESAPSAVHVAMLGQRRLENGFVENVADWEPFYLKSFVAKPPRPIFG